MPRPTLRSWSETRTAGNGPTVHALYGGSALARSTLGDLDSGLEGAESAKLDEMPWSIYDERLATA